MAKSLKYLQRLGNQTKKFESQKSEDSSPSLDGSYSSSPLSYENERKSSDQSCTKSASAQTQASEITTLMFQEVVS